MNEDEARLAVDKGHSIEEPGVTPVWLDEKLAAKLGVKPAQVALAWTLAKGITAPIIGATKPHHLSDALGALEIKLDAKTIAALERAYQPRPVMGHQ